MPFLLIPLLAGGVGFGVGFFSGSATSRVVTVAAVGGAAYVGYRYFKGGK